MDGLIELIFDGVPDGAIHGLVRNLIHGSDILDISHSELGSLDPKRIGEDLMAFFDKETVPITIFIRTTCIMVGGISINRPLVRILRFQGSNEVAVEFNSTDIDATDRKDTVAKLAAGAKVLADSAAIPKYYCGFEPATDTRTRLFSQGKVGPLIEV